MTAAPSNPWRLTKREHQVLELCATGLTDKAIGLQLGISRETSRSHIQSAMRKMGVHNRPAMTARFARNGVDMRPWMDETHVLRRRIQRAIYILDVHHPNGSPAHHAYIDRALRAALTGDIPPNVTVLIAVDLLAARLIRLTAAIRRRTT